MEISPEHNERIAKMTFATVYLLYIKKVEKVMCHFINNINHIKL